MLKIQHKAFRTYMYIIRHRHIANMYIYVRKALCYIFNVKFNNCFLYIFIINQTATFIELVLYHFFFFLTQLILGDRGLPGPRVQSRVARVLYHEQEIVHLLMVVRQVKLPVPWQPWIQTVQSVKCQLVQVLLFIQCTDLKFMT